MGFNGQPNMFFGKIIFYTCDLLVKLYSFNSLNIFLPNIKKIEYFALKFFPSNFQNYEVFVCFGFSSSLSNEHVLS